jgi:hypothetical protein
MLKATEINTLEDGFGITRGLRLTSAHANPCLGK